MRQVGCAILLVSLGRTTATEEALAARRGAGEYADREFVDLARERIELQREVERLKDEAAINLNELNRLQRPKLACHTRTHRLLRRSHAESPREKFRRAPFISSMSSIPEHLGCH